MTSTAEARAANAVLLHTDLRRDIEGLIRDHGADSEPVSRFISDRPLAGRDPFWVDTVLYALALEERRLSRNVAHAIESVHHAAGDRRNYGRGLPTWNLDTTTALAKVTAIARTDTTYVGTQAKKALETYDGAVAALERAKAISVPLHLEYRRRPWSRAFLVTDGHAHSSTACSTCFPTTEFTWLPFLSGRDEAEIVALSGERACTVCYPSAPTLRDFEKASPLFTEEEEERAKAREQRAAEKTARQAKKIAAGLTEDGSEFVVSYVEPNAPGWDLVDGERQHVYKDRERSEHFKTEKAAVQWVVQYRSWGEERYAYKQPAFQAIYEAVAAKHGRTVEAIKAEIDAKVAAKIKRDSR